MIDDRQPVVGPIRPVVGEERPLAVAVRADREAVGRDAAIADLDAAPFAGRGLAVQRHEEPVVLLPELEGRVGEGRRGDDHAAGRPAVAGFSSGFQAAVRGRVVEIEPDLANGSQDAKGDGRPSLDLVRLVREFELEAVVEDIDRRAGQLRPGARRRGQKERQRQTHRNVPQSTDRGHVRSQAPACAGVNLSR